jgi:putative PIN family toxin of toxin-antitoxin system
VKVVFDTNVYISDALFDASAEVAVKAAQSGVFSLYISEFILNEIRVVLVSHFKTTRRFASLTAKRARTIAKLVELHRRHYGNLLNENDHPILETAINSGADFLVTGDKRILALSPFHGITILRIGSFCRVLKENLTG